jgi:hypothetical protein
VNTQNEYHNRVRIFRQPAVDEVGM